MFEMADKYGNHQKEVIDNLDLPRASINPYYYQDEGGNIAMRDRVCSPNYLWSISSPLSYNGVIALNEANNLTFL